MNYISLMAPPTVKKAGRRPDRLNRRWTGRQTEQTLDKQAENRRWTGRQTEQTLDRQQTEQTLDRAGCHDDETMDITLEKATNRHPKQEPYKIASSMLRA